MIPTDFNSNWEVLTGGQGGLSLAPAKGKPVTLPYDDLIHRDRDHNAPTGNKKGYYPNGTVTLVKHLMVPKEWAANYVTLEFEGVYTHSKVYVNDQYAGGEPTGYASFLVSLDRFLRYGQTNDIKVTAVSADDSRWYSGLGVYRDVHLYVGNEVQIPVNGLRVRAMGVADGLATLAVTTQVINHGHHAKDLTARITLDNADGKTVASTACPLTMFGDGDREEFQQRLDVADAQLWSSESPTLYTLQVAIMDGDQVIDTAQTSVGIRTLALNRQRGLMVNGQTVKLRGACLHHDNGLIGAADIRAAEWRRIQKLHAAGFNAIRCSHNQASQNILDACDHYGVLVLNELSDAWDRPKNPQDVAQDFTGHWKYMARSLVNSSYNHPSVVLYSIGNEIQSLGTPYGAQQARKIVAYLRQLDNTRYITDATNFLVTLGAVIAKKMQQGQAKNGDHPAKMDINALAANMSSLTKEVIEDELTGQATAESFAALDIAGYNYGTARYVMDGKKYPHRLILGTETYPYQISENWALIKKYPYLLGDFTWTGWDYLGECGIGQMHYGRGQGDFYGQYPWRTAASGDFDLLGNRCPVSYYREIVFGKRQAPYIAVRYPWIKKEPNEFGFGSWGFIDGISSWTWRGYEGQDVTVEVYAAGEEATLTLNGHQIATQAVKDHRAIFNLPYQPGTLTATSAGKSFSLQTAGKVDHIRAQLEENQITNNSADLAYVDLALVDKNGRLNSQEDCPLTITVDGPAKLVGFGNANPQGEDNYADTKTHTYHGQAQAILRPTQRGEVTVTISNSKLSDAKVKFQIAPSSK